jgi:hypothetical protein
MDVWSCMSGYNLKILYIFNATSWIVQLKVKVLVIFLEKRILIISCYVTHGD